MVLPLAAAAARRRVGGMIAKNTQRRAMGGGAPAKEWEGVDKVVRDVFPEDHQRAFLVGFCVKSRFQIPSNLFVFFFQFCSCFGNHGRLHWALRIVQNQECYGWIKSS